MSSAGVVLAQFREDDVLSPTRFIDRPSPCSEESIMIYLTVAGSVIPMRVMWYDSIASVKLRIQTCRGFVVKKQKLVFRGRELARNDSLVRDYGVSDGNVLQLFLRPSELQVITVKTACGKEFWFHVEKGRNVGYVKQQIAKKGKEFLNLDEQELICNGEKLEDQKLVDDICKDNDAVSHLFISKSVKVRTKPVEKDFKLSVVAPDDEVESQRMRLEELQTAARSSPEREFNLEPVKAKRKIALPSVINDLITSTFAGLDNGNSPVRSAEGSGGAYFMRDFSGCKYVSVFKPVDEEPMAVNNPQGLPLSENGEGLKKGTRVGEGALREVAAYILDHPLSGPRITLSNDVGFAGVPPTVIIKCLHESFHHPQGFEYSSEFVKAGSLQLFVKNDGSCEDMGPRDFPVEEVHKISVLDIRLTNADRHAGNILVSREEGPDGRIVLVPIDHGYCLPENFEDCTFDWLYWPQARQPFSTRSLNYIKSLDAEKDIAILRYYGWNLPSESARTLRISTMLLKKGAERSLTPFAIGSIMCRETLKKESVIEEIVREAEDSVLPGMSEAAFLESVSQIMDRRLDELAA